MSILLRFAKFAAARWHEGQMYSGIPYTHHLADVETEVVRHWPKWWKAEELEHMRAAAWLHDVIEDREIKRKELEEQFGPFVAELVWRVSNEPGQSRRIRQALTYPKTREHPQAVYLKLCDRLANVRQGGSQARKYREEQDTFRRMLYSPGEFDEMWDELDALLRELA